jgi:hypothetical protein
MLKPETSQPQCKGCALPGPDLGQDSEDEQSMLFMPLGCNEEMRQRSRNLLGFLRDFEAAWRAGDGE